MEQFVIWSKNKTDSYQSINMRQLTLSTTAALLLSHTENKSTTHLTQ